MFPPRFPAFFRSSLMKSLIPCLMLSMLFCCADTLCGQWCGRICGSRIQRSCCPPPMCVNRCGPSGHYCPPVTRYQVVPNCGWSGYAPGVVQGQSRVPLFGQHDPFSATVSTEYRQCVITCLSHCDSNNDNLLHQCIGQCYCRYVLKYPNCAPSPCSSPNNGIWGASRGSCR